MLVAVYAVFVLEHVFLKGINHRLWVVVSSSVLSVLKNGYFFSSEFFPNL
jgi:hypothetical protein